MINEKCQMENGPITWHAAPKSSSSLYDRQNVTRVYRRAQLSAQGNDFSRLRSFHLVLHLHRFHYYDAGAGIYLITDCDQNAHDFAGHGSDDPGHVVAVANQPRGAAQSFRIGSVTEYCP